MSILGHIDRFIAEADDARNSQDINFVLRKHIEHLGFEAFSYVLLWPPEGPRFPLHTGTFPREWTKRYLEAQHIRHDMVTRHSATAMRPFLWSEIPNLRNMSQRQRQVFDEASEFKLTNGGTVPLTGPGLAKALFVVSNFSLSEAAFEKLFLERRHEVQLIGSYAHERMMAVGLNNPPPAPARLTPRETEIMTYTAVGKTAWDISVILGVSEDTVKEHISNVCQKFGVYSKTHAAAISIINALITL